MSDPSNEMEGSETNGPATAPSEGEVKRDVAYGPEPAQRLDVYLPKGAQRAPVLVMVHGGAWRLGDKAMDATVTNKAAHWVPKGYAFVSVNYGMSPPDPLRQAADVARALAFAQTQADSWGADPERFVLMGHSSGAHLVALIASDPSIAQKAGAKPWLGTIVLDSAALDVTRIMKARHFRLYDKAFGDDPSYWHNASPIHRLAGAPKPMLLVCSSLRGDSCPQAEAFAQKVGSLGGSARVMPIAKPHGQINRDLGTPGSYTDAVVSFLKSLGLP
jgi:acetyl esterase/lipase